jgi:hypothetical protein
MRWGIVDLRQTQQRKLPKVFSPPSRRLEGAAKENHPGLARCSASQARHV